MRNVMLLFVLFLSGCSVNYSAEGRGFIYEGLGVKFTCSHTPSKTEVKIDKEAFNSLVGILSKGQSDSGKNKEAQLAEALIQALKSDPKQLVILCQQLIGGKKLNNLSP